MRTGTADLPLHTGRCPRWLFERMEKLGGAISEAIVLEYGRDELLKRLADPYFFQSLGCVIGFDWHSSGLTTTVCGALKMGIDPEELGVAVLGGKGKARRKTPEEIEQLSGVFSLSTGVTEDLLKSSRLSAQVDTSAVQDFYQLYHHCFVVSEDGEWTVIQQGMNPDNKYARRYHWLSENIKRKNGKDVFLEDPHSAVCCDRTGETLNLASVESGENRECSLDLVKDGPRHLRKYLTGQSSLMDFGEGGIGSKARKLRMGSNHLVADMDERNIRSLRKAYEVQPESYSQLLSVKGVGPKTVRSLALISELIYGAEANWEDPARFSFSHGGKDGIPYPVDRGLLDENTKLLKNAVEQAKLGKKEKLKTLKKLKNLYQG